VQVIQFTEGATNPLIEPRVHAARFVQLAEGSGESHLGYLRIRGGGGLPRRSAPQDAALLTVQGTITIIADSGLRLEVASGVGVVVNADEFFSLESAAGGIMVLIQSPSE
jgi:hypothetical protein